RRQYPKSYEEIWFKSGHGVTDPAGSCSSTSRSSRARRTIRFCCSRLYRSSYPEAESIEPDIDVTLEADSRADEFALVTPGAATDHAVIRVAAPKPCGSVRRGAVVVLVPAILNPLPDIAEHVVKPESVWLE